MAARQRQAGHMLAEAALRMHSRPAVAWAGLASPAPNFAGQTCISLFEVILK
jgi:hypothetical protein